MLSWLADLLLSSLGSDAVDAFDGRECPRSVARAQMLFDMGSLQVLTATRTEFAAAVADALPAMRFHPLHVEECAVPSYVYMPFQFRLTGPWRVDD